MKVKLNISDLIVDVENLPALDALLKGAEKYDYDYNKGDAIYYIKPMSDYPALQAVPEDKYEALKLVYVLNYKDKK